MRTVKDPSTRLRLAQDDIIQHFSTLLSSIGYFEKKPTLAVAVSGGADSMALLLLADAWARQRKGRAVALTVDHGLRKESAAEAKQVAAWCKRRGIEHHTLRWKHPPPSSRGRKISQAKARTARYELLTSWCRKHRILHLLTAHHLNDQAETLLLRLSRGSFIEGLASMPVVSFRGGVRLLRPLLAFPKSELKDFLVEEKQEWIEDPSNLNPRYTRNAIRPHINEATAQRAAALASRLGVIRRRLEHALAAAMVHTVEIYSDHAVLKEIAFKTLPETQGLRLLSALLMTLANLDMPPRTEQVRLLYRDLTAKHPSKRRSLAGCEFIYQPKFSCFRVESALSASHIPPKGRKRAQRQKNRRFRPAKPLAGAPFLGLNGLYA